MVKTTARTSLVLAAVLAFSSAAAQAPAPATPAARLVAAARERTHHDITYDSRYARIPYPGGDVDSTLGVCTDVVVRSFRAGLGIDLQRLVHEDMAQHFDLYPSRRIWQLDAPDRNIDHRRVPNMRRFLARHALELPLDAEYDPGDIVSWNLTAKGWLPHIGIVVDERGASGHLMVVHNIGAGPRMEDVLFDWEVTGHFRYFGPESTE